MFNPDCTPGWTTGTRTSETGVTAHCGCGWSEPGHPSKTQAKAAQRAHRFPGVNPMDELAGRVRPAPRPASSGSR